MKIIVAPDSFKDALSALEVCRAIERGLRRAEPDAEIVLFPLADGGEGTAEVVAWHLNGETVKLNVGNPLRRLVSAQYFLSAEGHTAYIEMAQASGLQLLDIEERNPLKTSSFGTGEMLLDAWRRGVENIFLGIGGSATNDAGIGMAAALGWRFFSKSKVELIPNGENLSLIETILPPEAQASPEFPFPRIVVLCDVDNPLYGPRGAAHVYARQKGADDVAIARLDEGLRHFSKIMMRQFGRDFSKIPGAGAAGGMGAGAMVFLNAQLKRGAEAAIELTGFEAALQNADLVITGEGRLDAQTLRGKLIHGICRKAAMAEVPVIAVCGAMEVDTEAIESIGLLAAFSLIQAPQSLPEAIAHTASGLERLSYSILKVFNCRK